MVPVNHAVRGSQADLRGARSFSGCRKSPHRDLTAWLGAAGFEPLHSGWDAQPCRGSERLYSEEAPGRKRSNMSRGRRKDWLFTPNRASVLDKEK
jgi:hypothetical protein